VPRIIPGAVDEIALPIANPAALLDNRRPCADMPFVRVPEFLSGTIRDTRPAFEAQVGLATLAPAMDPVVYRSVTYRAKTTAPPHVAGYLLGGEGTLQQLLDRCFQPRIIVDDPVSCFSRFASSQQRALGVNFVVDAGAVRVPLYLPFDRGTLPSVRAISANDAQRESMRRMISRSAKEIWV
jgi:hypothetical protein